MQNCNKLNIYIIDTTKVSPKTRTTLEAVFERWREKKIGIDMRSMVLGY